MALTRISGKDVRDRQLTDQDMALANVDGLPAVPSLRTLGTGAQQACAGNDSRLGAASMKFKLIQITFPVSAGNALFTITDPDVVSSSKILCSQATGDGDGMDADENEMDAFTYAAFAKEGSFDLYVSSLFGDVAGTYSVRYLIGS